MKYERQQHSPLFIELQETKRKIEKAAIPHILQGRAGIIFSFAKEEFCPIFRMHICHGNGIGQASRIREPVQVPSMGSISTGHHFT